MFTRRQPKISSRLETEVVDVKCIAWLSKVDPTLAYEVERDGKNVNYTEILT